MLAEALEASHFRLFAGVASADSLPGVLLRACGTARAGRDLVLQLSVHTAALSEGELGLVLEDAGGKSNVLRREQLAQLLAAYRFGLSKLHLLFLSSCWSEQLAPLFVEHGCRHVLAVKGRVHDRAARKFARAFYTTLRARVSLLEAFECARQWLLIDPDAVVKEAADQFVLFGDRDSVAQATLGGGGGENFDRHFAEDLDIPLQGLEEAAMCLRMDALPPNPQFVGRAPLVHDILLAFRHSRAFVLFGPSGIGKETAAVELARFASAPGRPFSCAAAVLHLPKDADDELLFELLLAELERLSFPHVGAVLGGEAPATRHGVAGLAARATYVLQALERRRRGPELVVVNDRAGLLARSEEARNLLGQLVDRTQRLHLVVCSTEPLYCFHGKSFRSINKPLQGLGPADAAKLFLRFKNRALDSEDFPGGVAPAESRDAVLKQLAEHPLLQQLDGHPQRICELAATKVVPSGPSLMELAERQAVGASQRRQTAAAAAPLPPAVRQGLRC